MSKIRILKREYNRILKQLEKKANEIKNIKNMMFVCPTPEELNNLPDTVENIVIDYLDEDVQFFINLPINLQTLIVLNTRRTEDDIKQQFKIPFGCKVVITYSNDKYLANFVKIKDINSNNIYTRQIIDGKVCCYNIIVDVNDDSIIFSDELPEINKLTDLQQEIGRWKTS